MPRPDTNRPDRLNRYLDAAVQGRHEATTDLDPELAYAVRRLAALDDAPAPAVGLRERTWEGLMNRSDVNHRPVSPLLAFPGGLRGPTPGGVLVRPNRGATGRSRWREGMAAAVVLLLTAAAAFAAYRVAPSADDSGGAPSAAGSPAADAPSLPGCEIEPRPNGTVARLAGERPHVRPLLPRFGDDPVYGAPSYGGSRPADGTLLFTGTQEVPAAVWTAIARTLAELVACRFYAIDGSRGIDTDGRYFALYTDDFFRRELSGYREAGMDPKLVSFWIPSQPLGLDEARVLSDGRVVGVLDTGTERFLEPGVRFIVLFAPAGDRWLVDEIGYAQFDTGAAGAATPTAAPARGSPPAPVPTPRGWDAPQVAIALYDAVVGTPIGMIEGAPTVCDPLSVGTPVPCGDAFQRFGPYGYNEFPELTDVTLWLNNAGSRPHRFVVEDLGIDVTVEPGGTAELTVNAPRGTYLFLIYEGDAPTPIGAGVLEFIPREARPTVG